MAPRTLVHTSSQPSYFGTALLDYTGIDPQSVEGVDGRYENARLVCLSRRATLYRADPETGAGIDVDVLTECSYDETDTHIIVTGISQVLTDLVGVDVGEAIATIRFEIADCEGCR